MRGKGLVVSVGTLADGASRMAGLFEPVSEAILARLMEAGTVHGDETSWRVESPAAERGSSRVWLWCAASRDAVLFHVDSSRSAEAAGKAGPAPPKGLDKNPLPMNANRQRSSGLHRTLTSPS